MADYQVLMGGIIELLASDADIPPLLRSRDMGALLTLYKEGFAKMREACGLTYLLFADDSSRVIVRVHQPGDQGDVVRRQSFTLAAQNAARVTTLDAGSDGRLSLRVVAPISLDGTHAGFVEVGMEMEHVLATVAQPEKVDIILALDKRHMSGERIHPGDTGLPGTASWVDPGGGSFLYTTFSDLDKESARVLLQRHAESGADSPDGDFSVKALGNHFRVTSMPLADSAGDRLGNLFILHNVTPLRDELVAAALALLGAILAVAAASRFFIARKLRDTDADFADMQNAFEEGERIFENVFAQSNTAFILRVAGADTVLKANAAALDAFSVTRAEDIDLARLTPLAADSLIQLAWQTPLLTIDSAAGSRSFEETRFSTGNNDKLECTALHEVTDGVHLQSENKAHISFLQTVINQLPGWVCIKNDSLRLTQSNDTFKALFGEAGEPDGMVCHFQGPGQKIDSLWEADREALRSGRAVTLELRVPGGQKVREDRVYVVTKQRFSGRDGQIHILSTGTDITERVRMVEQITRLHEKAEEGSRAKTQFIARMSHELRTPMNAVLGMSYLALRLSPEGQLREYVTKIQKSSEGLLKIITDILNFSEMEAGEARLLTKPFDLMEELHAVKAQTLALLGQKPVEFILEASGAGGQFLGDAPRLRQALLALCDNAAKFTENGTVRLRCVVMARQGRTHDARFAVEDTGKGIAGEHLEHLFDSFHQVDGGTTRQFGGIGLGLALAGQAVALMGGRLGVESAPGRGSCFSFSITLESPAREEKDVASETAAAGEQTVPAPGVTGTITLPPGNILVVEDNELNQEIILELLVQAGMRAQVVDNGQKAVNIVQEQPFDLVLMDLQMPVMGGIEATRRIREHKAEAIAMLPIIAVTANAQESDRADCAEAGMNDFLSKPVNVEELYAKLRRWLPAQEQ